MSAPTVVLLTLSVDELRALVRGEVDAALATRASATSVHAQRLALDELAHLESCSRATVRRLVAEGGPVHYLGASPRFDLDEWRAWCAERGRAATKAMPSKRETIPGVRLLSRGKR